VEAECGRKLRVLRTDNGGGGEFTTAEFASYCADEGVQRHYSAPYSPQTVAGMARALLKQRGMLAVFWGEAVVTTIYILNCSPTKALNGRTPYEAWHGRKPAVSHLRVFSCLAFARSIPRVFIGYAEGSKAYRILDPGTQHVHTTRDVVFDERRGWAWDSGGRRLDSDVRQFHRRVRPLQGSWGSRQFSSTEHVYPSPRASTDLSATLSSHDLGCNEVFATTTIAGDPMHSSIGGHPSGHVHSDTSSCRAQPGGVRYFALPRRGAHRHIPRRRAVAVSYDGEPSQRPAGAGTGPSRSGGAIASCVR
jgi:hypothetical protein